MFNNDIHARGLPRKVMNEEVGVAFEADVCLGPVQPVGKASGPEEGARAGGAQPAGDVIPSS